jgi:hypothetical protein
MELTIRISGIEPAFDAHSFYLKRSMGKSPEYGVVLKLNYATRYRLEEIAQILKDKKNRFSIEWQHQPILNEAKLFRIESSQHDREIKLVFSSLMNRYASYKPGPFTPRKRVLSGSNMLELVRNYFSNLVDFDDTVEFALQKIKFPDKDKTNIIQYRDTDHEMLQKIISWYNYLAGYKEALMISGAPAEGKFQLTWVQPAKCLALKYDSTRRLEDKINSKYAPEILIGYSKMPPPEIYNQNIPAQNICYQLNRDGYNDQEWHNWKTFDIPCYYQNRFVYEMYDVFTRTAQDNLDWISYIGTLAAEEKLHVPKPASLEPWSGIGKVKNRTETGFWMEVELPDFEPEHNLAQVRVTSNYSGHEGNAGLHLIPEKETEVLIHKGTNWLDPVVLLNNVRSKPVIEKAPFWKLEDVTKWDFNSLSVKLKDITTTAEENITMKTKGVTAKIDNSKMDIS